MKHTYTLAVKKAGDTVGLIRLNPYYTERSRYIDILQDNVLVERFDLSKDQSFSVSTVLEIVDIAYRDHTSTSIGSEVIDLRPFTEVKEEGFLEEERFTHIKTVVQDEMDNPSGTDKERAKHTEMLRMATIDASSKEYVISRMTQILLKQGLVAEDELQKMTYRIFGDLYGMGVLQELDDDPEMGEIMVNAVTFPEFHCDIYYVKNGQKYKYDRTFQSLSDLKKVFQRSIDFDNKELNSAKNSRVEATRPNRDRVTIIIPDASDNWSMNIRKFTNFIPNLDTMRRSGTVNNFIDRLMSVLVRGKSNIGIGGAMGTGKTTFINFLLSYTPRIERKVVIASVSETDVDRVLKGHDVLIFNVDDDKGFTFEELMRTSLRTTADRVIIPESRGGEFKQLYEANLKTKGNMFTAHALDDRSFMDMCVDMYMSSPDVTGAESSEFLRDKITKALDVVIIMRRVGPHIRIKSISEVMQDKNGNYAGMNALYEWTFDPENPLEGEYKRTEHRISEGLKRRLNENGITPSELAGL